MSKRFEKSLNLATDSTVLETDWDAVLDCVDQIRGGEAKAPEAMVLVLSRLKNENPHVVLHALILLEAMVKNCGKKVHNELATREFMEGIKELAIEAKAETVKTKVLELLQCWAMAFANKAEYKIIVDTHNLMKLAGFDFPSVKEADAMFASQVAPEWEEGANCYRCRSEFTFLTRKHHCRACGQIFCHGCSSKEMLLPQFGIEKPVRVCDACYEKGVGVALNKQSATAARPKFFSSVEESSVVDQFGVFYWDSIATRNALAQDNPNRSYATGNPRAVANRPKQAEKPEGLFKSLFKGVRGNKKKPESSYNPTATDPGAEERERQARLAREKEEEDYQLNLAMAISQSEAEAKEKERANSLYSFYNGVKDQVNSHVSSPMNDTMSIAPSEHIGVYKGAAESVRESPSENSLNADDPLARYLNRDYWQQRKDKANAKVENWDINPSAPLPSEPSLGGSSYVPTVRGSPPPNNQKELVYSTGLSALDEETFQKSEDTKKFCADVNEQVESMENRIRSNMARGRPIYNDTAIQGIYMRLTELHSQVMQRLNDLEQQRIYFESLQDQLGHITEARAAVNSLREEEARKRAEVAAEEQRVRQLQMQNKLAAMRQQKHDMLLYQRQVAIQRFQQQEAEMAVRRSQQFYSPASYANSPQVQQYPYSQMHGQMPMQQYTNQTPYGYHETTSQMQPNLQQQPPQQPYSGQQVNEAGNYPLAHQNPNGYSDGIQMQRGAYLPHATQPANNVHQVVANDPTQQGYQQSVRNCQQQYQPSQAYDPSTNNSQYNVTTMAPSANQYYQQHNYQGSVNNAAQHYQEGMPMPNAPVQQVHANYLPQANIQPSDQNAAQEGLLISFD